MKKLIFLRRLSQTIFLFLFIYILWSTTYPLKSTLSPSIFFRLNPLITFTTSVSGRAILPGVVFSIGMILLTLIFGRFFCGWICPLGMTIDMVGAARKEKVQLRDAVNKKLSLPKFFILGIITIFSLIGIQVAWVLDPMVIMARFVSLNLIPMVTLLIDKFLIMLLETFGRYEALYDFYRMLKSSFLGINVYYFAHSDVIFLFFLFVIGSTLCLSRFWCRAICPLGAIYALCARVAPLRRVVDKCIKCKQCRSVCRTGAIKDDFSYNKSECILCMDCIYECPHHMTRFSWSGSKKQESRQGITRRNFLFLILSSSAFLLGFKNTSKHAGVIRPPAALKEDKFLDRCIRCGNCMKVCITNGLQPVLLQTGLSGIWTPQLVPEVGYCEYNCTLCGNVCPTGALPSLTLKEKKRTHLGTAKVNHSTCIPWSRGAECIVCEEHCPIPEKAIKLKKIKVGDTIISAPLVDTFLCVGCGVCQAKCPVRPERAIKVHPRGADRT